MGDFELRLPTRQRGYSLGVPQLQLDPDIQRQILALQSQPPSPQLRNLFLRPNWATMQQDYLNQLLRQPPPQPGAPLVPRGRGPTTPRAAELSDLFAAIWAIPVVQQSANRVLDDAAGRIRRDWTRLSTGQQAIVISHSALLLGSALAAIGSNTESRNFMLGLISDFDIPVPVVDGLTFRLNPRGASATMRNIGGSGVTVQGGGGVNRQGQPEYNIGVTLDLRQFMPR